jgi:hypothetical protein
MPAISKWEEEHRSEIMILYKKLFENNSFFKVTYNDFVIYCYKHTL